MWNALFNRFRLVHAAIFAFAAFGLFGFWARTRFWLPKYVHLLAGIGLLSEFWPSQQRRWMHPSARVDRLCDYS